ncbi:MAG: hypothetical protein E6Q70_17280 [Pseudomonas monteilii]|nr:MAG: hypothetical protein E6Q70_17280 [Pseudomonas monteilii]HDS0956612.1 DUF4935 domain-containing protein [Pseudomonas putida]
MELRSRLVFVDTNIYEGKNFQFLTHSLGALKELIDSGEVRLLVTDVTKGEVVSHIKKKASAAASEIKSFKKSSMILRNLPDAPVYGVFAEITKDSIADTIIQSFNCFLDSEHVELVSIDSVKPSYIFDRYFNSQAPFAIGEKEKEFADAFVLKALDDLSEQRGHNIHVISNDRDMSRFSEEHPRLVWSDSIDEYIDAVNKSVSIEPAAFAESALEHVMASVMSIIQESLEEMQDEFQIGGWDSELDSADFSNVELVASNLIRVNEEECAYELYFKFSVETVEFEKDYDRSPFDHEDDNYPFVLENRIERTIDAEGSMQITLGYQDKLIDSVYVVDYDAPLILKRSQPYHETVKHLDINGE